MTRADQFCPGYSHSMTCNAIVYEKCFVFKIQINKFAALNNELLSVLILILAGNDPWRSGLEAWITIWKV